MKNTLALIVLCGVAATAHAVQVEFNVPVELRNIDPAATHVVVTCGSWGDNRFLNSQRTEVALQNAQTHKSYSGVVKVVVSWPGANVPSGAYRCAMAMRGTNLFADFETRPAAPRSTVATFVMGDFRELQLQDTKSMIKTAPTAPLVRPLNAPIAPSK
jgi:hypothetical protein